METDSHFFKSDKESDAVILCLSITENISSTLNFPPYKRGSVVITKYGYTKSDVKKGIGSVI